MEYVKLNLMRNIFLWTHEREFENAEPQRSSSRILIILCSTNIWMGFIEKDYKSNSF